MEQLGSSRWDPDIEAGSVFVRVRPPGCVRHRDGRGAVAARLQRDELGCVESAAWRLGVRAGGGLHPGHDDCATHRAGTGPVRRAEHCHGELASGHLGDRSTPCESGEAANCDDRRKRVRSVWARTGECEVPRASLNLAPASRGLASGRRRARRARLPPSGCCHPTVWAAAPPGVQTLVRVGAKALEMVRIPAGSFATAHSRHPARTH